MIPNPLDLSQIDRTSMLLALIATCALLVFVASIIVYVRWRQSSKARRRATMEVKEAAEKAGQAVAEAERAAQGAENAALVARQAATRMLELIGDHAVAQSVVEQAVQAQGAAAFELATKAIEQIVETQLSQSGNAAQVLVEARRQAQAAQSSAKEAETFALKAERLAAQAATMAERAKQKASIGILEETAEEAEQAALRAKRHAVNALQSARRLELAAIGAGLATEHRQIARHVFDLENEAMETERAAFAAGQEAKAAMQQAESVAYEAKNQP
jgi:hypothetical protein